MITILYIIIFNDNKFTSIIVKKDWLNKILQVRCLDFLSKEAFKIFK